MCGCMPNGSATFAHEDETGPALARLSLALRSVTFRPRYWSALRLGNHTNMARIGEAAMSVVLNDLLLFSCLAAFVTGIVIAAATLLI